VGPLILKHEGLGLKAPHFGSAPHPWALPYAYLAYTYTNYVE